MISEKPLREWKLPEPAEQPTNKIDQELEPIVKKATIRKEAKKHKKELAATIAESITTKDGKTTIDVAELNQKTGTRVMIDILEGSYIITVMNLPK